MLRLEALGFYSRTGLIPILAAPGAGIRALTGAFKAELAQFIAAHRSVLGSGINMIEASDKTLLW
eukprot:3551512-Rhodomonas_salina.3